MKNLKIWLLLMIFVVTISWAFAVDWDYGTNFSFSPASGSLWKLYCDFPVSFIIDWSGNKYNGFAARIAFDSSNVEIATWSIDPIFEGGILNSINWNLYSIWWNIPWSTEPWKWYKQWILTGVTFILRTKENINSTTLSLVWWNGLPPERFWLDTTDDGITLDGFDVVGDVLTSITNATYNFVALPCVADNQAPTIWNLVKSWTSESVNNTSKVLSGQALSFDVYDRDADNKVTYWFNREDPSVLDNYVHVPNSNNVDNQEWVDSSSISVTVSCPTCSSPKSNIPVTHLSISDWNWDSTKNAWTWDSERRWYNVSFNAPFTYEVEKEVTVNVSVSDNQNENGQVHTGTKSFSFNAPKAPDISHISPSTDDFVSPSREFPIVFEISDDWAGVDTWKIVISTIYSGNEFIYSGSDLTFTWWDAGLWNAWSYVVSFTPKEDFPVSTKVRVNVTWVDLAWTTGTYRREFTTRPSCDFFWCIDNLIITGGISYIFTWKFLSITWTNPDSPYPYFTWENNEILMCGKDWTWINFVGIPIYDVTWNLLWWSTYTNHQLIITWLNFVFNSWVILIQ